MKKLSNTKKLFQEIISDMNRAHRFVSRTEWSILYDDEEFRLGRDAKIRNERRQSLQRLKERKMIKIKKVANKIMIELTGRGRHQALIQLIQYKKIVLPNEKVCIVFFDIPERVRFVRKEINYLLSNSGFERIQKSVWMSVYDVVNEISVFIKLMKAEKWIRVCIAG